MSPQQRMEIKTELKGRSEISSSSQTSNLQLSNEMSDANGLFWK